MTQQDAQSEGGATLVAPESNTASDFLAGEVMKQFWNDDGGVATMAAKKKAPAKKAPAKKTPAKKPPAKPTKKPRPTRNRPGCFTTPASGCVQTKTHTAGNKRMPRR